MVTVHIGKVSPLPPRHYRDDDIEVVLVPNGCVWMKAKNLLPGDLIQSRGIVTRVEAIKEAA